ncbi:cytochrome c biogenesis protein ResB [Microbacterium lacus]|uniref:cytochrome c biogenesis protein ResB n=1 Tax=Microbacterium lacus TaxID=415217 RepID=UPI000C2C384E|nr:cytochrome c biogenesis protein ResB [Microbacterium lacus]
MSNSLSDPLRPSDHADGAADVSAPRLGPVEWLRWAWRQVTSMRTALVLLLLLAIAAIPGSLVPQRSADPNGVTQYYTDQPDLAPILDGLSLFDVYTSPWFSAIYLLLFLSLIGCVIPRAKHHAKALMSRPPRTPVRLSRLADYEKHSVEASEGTDASAQASDAVDLAAKQLRRAGYRVERDDSRGSWSVSAERGYLRETGNLVFHIALVGVLIAVGFGGGFAYTAQRVVVEGTTFVNTLTDYSSFNPGRFVDGTTLAPYAVTLDEFQVSYQGFGTNAVGQAGDFAAVITTREPDGQTTEDAIRVNHPVDLAGDKLYLLGNGYAPTIVVRDAEGVVRYRESQPFLPQDTNMTSLGVVKVADGFAEQLGMIGFFYPTQDVLTSGAYTSTFPDLINPVLTLNVFQGDLGINDGTPRSVYTLDVGEMTQLTGGSTGVDSIELRPGETADLPNGLGTVTFEDESATIASEAPVKRFASLQVHRDPSAVWVLVFAVLALLGLLTALFVPRRRVWVKAAVRESEDGPLIDLEYAGLARGEDPALRAAVTQVADRHLAAFDHPVVDALEPGDTGSGDRRDAPTPDVN